MYKVKVTVTTIVRISKRRAKIEDTNLEQIIKDLFWKKVKALGFFSFSCKGGLIYRVIIIYQFVGPNVKYEI